MSKTQIEKEVIAWNPPIDWVKEAIEMAGNTIGSVHFNKRSGKKELRKMCYRLHVNNPSVAATPKGQKVGKCSTGPYKDAVKTKSRKDIDIANTQITVLDANKVVRDKDGEVIGRGAWRCIPLEKVIKIRNKGTTYVINRND